MGKLSYPQAILFGGLIAGTLDIGAAALINMRSPVMISQFIAGGLLGKPALEGGMQTAALGVALQWAMSILIAAIYVFASTKIEMLRSRWLLSGVAYGIPVFAVMEYVVLPLSAWHRFPKFTAISLAENMMAMMVFGLIIAFFASKTR